MSWTDPEMKERFKITKPIWHRKLISLACERGRAWKYIADAGCGRTGLLDLLWHENWQIGSKPILGVGFDDDYSSLSECRKRAAEARLPLLFLRTKIDKLKALRRLGFDFDIVFCWEVLYLLDDRSLRRAIASIRSLLDKEGLFVCGTVCHRSVPDAVMDACYPLIEQRIAPAKPYWRLESDYVQVLRENGFSVDVVRITYSEQEYAAIASFPPHKLWMPDEMTKRTYYTEYGKSVWLCTPNR